MLIYHNAANVRTIVHICKSKLMVSIIVVMIACFKRKGYINIFKITCFMPHPIEKLAELLKGFSFVNTKSKIAKTPALEWKLDGHVFRIEPLKHERYYEAYGYRVFFNGSSEGGAYLFDMALGRLSPEITGVEYDFYYENRTKNEWIFDLQKRPSYREGSLPGLYQKGATGIVILDDRVNLQIRSPRKKSLELTKCLNAIDQVRDDITPDKFDLFSIVEGGAAV